MVYFIKILSIPIFPLQAAQAAETFRKMLMEGHAAGQGPGRKIEMGHAYFTRSNFWECDKALAFLRDS